MQSWFHRARSVLLVGLPLAVLFAASALGDELRLAIGGYDTVAYFTDAKAVPGKPEFKMNGTTQLGNLPVRRTATCLLRTRITMPRNTMAIVPWAYRIEGGHKDTVDPRGLDNRQRQAIRQSLPALEGRVA